MSFNSTPLEKEAAAEMGSEENKYGLLGRRACAEQERQGRGALAEMDQYTSNREAVYSVLCLPELNTCSKTVLLILLHSSMVGFSVVFT